MGLRLPAAPGGRRASPGWLRWAAATAGALAVLGVLALILGGTYVPRKNAARDLKAQRQRIAVLLSSAPPEERGNAEGDLDCVIRAVFRARLTAAEVAPLRQACAAAVADGVITRREAAEIRSAASALCRRAGGPEEP